MEYIITDKRNQKIVNNICLPTPIPLVNEMLDKIPKDFWKTPKKIFDPFGEISVDLNGKLN